jgi:hypothetical protein
MGPSLRPAIIDTEVAPTAVSPIPNPQEPTAPEDLAGSISPDTIQEVGESSGARPFLDGGLLMALLEGEITSSTSCSPRGPGPTRPSRMTTRMRRSRPVNASNGD